jgi:hypothetical protein
MAILNSLLPRVAAGSCAWLSFVICTGCTKPPPEITPETRQIYRRAAMLMHPDRRADAEELARRIGAEGAMRRIDAILACRLAIEQNVKPRIALEALTVALRLPA